MPDLAEIRAQLAETLKARPEMIYGPAGALAGALAGMAVSQVGAKRKSKFTRAVVGAGVGAGLGGAAGVAAGTASKLPRSLEEAGDLAEEMKLRFRNWYGIKEPVLLRPDRAVASTVNLQGDPGGSFTTKFRSGGVVDMPPVRAGVPSVELFAHGSGYPGRYTAGLSYLVPSKMHAQPADYMANIKESLKQMGVQKGQPWDLRWYTCNRLGGAGPDINKALCDAGLAPSLLERAPAYAYGGEEHPAFDFKTGKPARLLDYVRAGKVYHESGMVGARNHETPQGGWWNPEVQTSGEPTREMLDIAKRWEDSELPSAALAKEKKSAGTALGESLGYGGKPEEFKAQWGNMVGKFKTWFARQKEPARPEAPVEPYRERPPIEQAQAAPANAELGETQMPPGYGLSQENRASVANMLRSYPGAGDLGRKTQMSQVLDTLSWMKPGVSPFTPEQQVLFNDAVARFDELRKAMSSEEAMKKLEGERPRGAPLVQQAIDNGFIIAKNRGGQEKVAYNTLEIRQRLMGGRAYPPEYLAGEHDEFQNALKGKDPAAVEEELQDVMYAAQMLAAQHTGRERRMIGVRQKVKEFLRRRDAFEQMFKERGVPFDTTTALAGGSNLRKPAKIMAAFATANAPITDEEANDLSARYSNWQPPAAEKVASFVRLCRGEA